ncbi:MAG: hypothetical protein BWY46_00919 [Firmicutes bacterium ADurb.Bin300]|nr:MAG: hypothetical protein BWY46_00919 [Firmicutes bacterium ADurb.Bin300]
MGGYLNMLNMKTFLVTVANVEYYVSTVDLGLDLQTCNTYKNDIQHSSTRCRRDKKRRYKYKTVLKKTPIPQQNHTLFFTIFNIDTGIRIIIRLYGCPHILLIKHTRYRLPR